MHTYMYFLDVGIESVDILRVNIFSKEHPLLFCKRKKKKSILKGGWVETNKLLNFDSPPPTSPPP